VSSHPLVKQLRFTRQEFVRCVKDVSPDDAVHRVLPLNCISWVIGHVANQEQRFWLLFAQDRIMVPDLNDLVGSGKPASTPPLNEMWTAWQNITEAADVYLDTVTTVMLQTHFINDGKPRPESVGTMLLRNIYHYWYHTGEAHAIRDMIGHRDLPQFVGDMPSELYSP
jgi:uncharacterized damage-inducible protein DinB